MRMYEHRMALVYGGIRHGAGYCCPQKDEKGVIGMSGKSRVYIWDNLKFLLMVFVVLGHFADCCIKEPLFQSIYVCIYAFHMPLFIFISGLFHKNENIVRKVFSYLCLFWLLKIAVYVVQNYVLGVKSAFSVFSEDGAPWFLFALAVFMLLSYVFREIDSKYIFAFSIILGCFAGYDSNIGDFLVLSRIFVFYPFYVMGTMMQGKIKNGLEVSRAWKILGAIVLLIWIWLCRYQLEFTYTYRGLFTGRNPFWEEIYSGGCLHRLLCYGISALTGVALMILIPRGEIPVVSKFGRRTLQVYFWHWLLIAVLMKYGEEVGAWCATPFGKAGYMLSAIGLTFVLSFKIFGYPLSFAQKIRKGRK